MELGEESQKVFTGAEESAHSLQDYTNFAKTETNRVTGKQMIIGAQRYKNQLHEITAKSRAGIAADQYERVMFQMALLAQN